MTTKMNTIFREKTNQHRVNSIKIKFLKTSSLPVFGKCSLQVHQLSTNSACNGVFQSLFSLKSRLSYNHPFFLQLIHCAGFPYIFLPQSVFSSNLLRITGVVLAPALALLLLALSLLLWEAPTLRPSIVTAVGLTPDLS